MKARGGVTSPTSCVWSRAAAAHPTLRREPAQGVQGRVHIGLADHRCPLADDEPLAPGALPSDVPYVSSAAEPPRATGRHR